MAYHRQGVNFEPEWLRREVGAMVLMMIMMMRMVMAMMMRMICCGNLAQVLMKLQRPPTPQPVSNNNFYYIRLSGSLTRLAE